MSEQTENTQVAQVSNSLATINGLKSFINKEAKGLFLSQISLPKEQAETLFIQELSFAIQAITLMSDSSREYFLKIANSNPDSLKFAISNVAASGLTLNPALRLAYLVPRKTGIIFQSSWLGKKELLLRSGMYLDAYANLVHENDVFRPIDMSVNEFEHVYNPFDSEAKRGKVIGGYGVALVGNGQKIIEFVNGDMLETLKNKSDAKDNKFSPWQTGFENDMLKKAVFNRLARVLPKTNLSENYLKLLAIEVDNASFEDAQLVEVQKDLSL